MIYSDKTAREANVSMQHLLCAIYKTKICDSHIELERVMVLPHGGYLPYTYMYCTHLFLYRHFYSCMSNATYQAACAQAPTYTAGYKNICLERK